MEIIVGKTSGFCGGVIRSVKETTNVLNKYGSIYCLGELVHNKQVVGELENKGLVVVDKLSDVPDKSRVIIRAHGVTKEVYEEAKRRNLEIVDLTCLNVIKIHNLATKLVNEGYFIVLTGKKSHPEAIGTISFCGKACVIIENLDEIDEVVNKIEKSGYKNIAVISQTTYSMSRYDEVVSELKYRLGDEYLLELHKTICNATELRQKEVSEIATLVDAMIIVGGRHSSNTIKLYEIASELCNNTFIVETVDDINVDFSKYEKVGIMAGASTPKESIDGVLDYLKEIDKNFIA